MPTSPEVVFGGFGHNGKRAGVAAGRNNGINKAIAHGFSNGPGRPMRDPSIPPRSERVSSSYEVTAVVKQNPIKMGTRSVVSCTFLAPCKPMLMAQVVVIPGDGFVGVDNTLIGHPDKLQSLYDTCENRGLVIHPKLYKTLNPMQVDQAVRKELGSNHAVLSHLQDGMGDLR